MMEHQKERVRPKIGDLIEIPLRNHELAYAQYINRHTDPPVFGALIRVLPGQFRARPNNLEHLVEQKERFFTFFPLGAASNRRLVRIAGEYPVPDRCRTWPLFKAYNENFETGKRTWWLWDGKKSWRIGDLPPEYYDLSMKETVDLLALQEMIESGWKPSDEVKEHKK